MAKLNYKLSEWFKTVDKSEAVVKNKKTKVVDTNQVDDTTTGQVNTQVIDQSNDSSSAVISNDNVVLHSESVKVESVKASSVAVVETPVKVESRPAPRTSVKTVAEISTAVEELPEKTVEELKRITEGTGSPRPMSVTEPAVSIPKVREIEELLESAEQEERNQVSSTVRKADVTVDKPQKKTTVQESPETSSEPDIIGMQENWGRLPHHLQILFSTPDEEVAQRSYKAFKETRAQLIERLLDPPLTLEETARILNVCPTTVRRYTNKNHLMHYRTAGNQRRFRLSDVLAFMESTGKASGNRKAKGDQ